ncbi:MAG: hypothetical protein AAF747_07795 [Planctomycetota bacterium]
MQSSKKLATVSIAGLALAGLGYLAMAQAPIPGGLEPPLGPVEDTTPSLAELEAKLDQILATRGEAVAEAAASVEVFYLQPSGSQTEAIQVSPGRVLFRGLSGFAVDAVVFDGPGEINIDGVVTTGTPVARVASETVRVVTSSSGQGWIGLTSDSVNVDIVVEDGLYLAWGLDSANPSVAVYYTPLD